MKRLQILKHKIPDRRGGSGSLLQDARTRAFLISPWSGLVAAVLLGGMAAQASIATYTFNDFGGSSSLAVPDGNAAGASDTRNITSDLGEIITSITVSLSLSSEFNGDLYAYLRHGDQISILLNRSGRTGTDAIGYADSGFNVTLSDDPANHDIHNYRDFSTPVTGVALTGVWQADGRNIDPEAVTPSDSRDATLNVFGGMNPGGDWTLFVADMSSGGTSSLTSWGLEITAVPEPAAAAVVAGLALLGFGLYRRRHAAASNRPQ